MKIKAELEFIKETKNTFRYREISEEPQIGDLYLKKQCMNYNPLKKLIIEISEGGNE